MLYPRILSRVLWALTAIAALACVYLVFRLVGQSGQPLERVETAGFPALQTSSDSADRADRRDYLAIAQNAVFGPPQAPAETSSAEKPQINSVLVGTIVHGSRALAIVETRAGGQRLLRVGEELGGGRIEKIQEGSVVVEFSGRKVEVPVTGLRPQPKSPARPAPKRPSPAVALPSAAQESGEVEYEEDVADIELEEFDAFAEQLAAALDSATWSAAHDAAGEDIGTVVERLPKDSLLRRIGLQPGDVVTEVNAIPIVNAEQMRQAFDEIAQEIRAGQESFIVIELIREQKSDTIILTIW